ncbi:MAG: TolB family protein, partial [Planctomycetota bacterium]
LTADKAGRRVSDFDFADGRIVYEWSPAQLISTRGHLVVLDPATGAETVLDDDMDHPWAASGSRVVLLNKKTLDDERKADLVLFDLDSGAKKTLVHDRISGLDLDSDNLVYALKFRVGSDIVLYDLTTGATKTISTGGSTDEVANRDPKIDGNFIAWEAYNYKTRTAAIVVYDIASGESSRFDIAAPLPRLEMSEGRIVYVQRQGKTADIHLYDISAQSDSTIASLEGLASNPFVEGDKIAWTEYIAKEEFKGVPGQPLMDEKDFRDIFVYEIFVYEIGSGKKKKVAGNLLATGGRAKPFGGRVYCNVYREYPPPGQSNLRVSVDLIVW